MRRLGLTIVLLLAVCGTASAATIPVKRCVTTFGFSTGRIHLPHRLTVQRSAAGLTAYTNTREYLLAPSGMHCVAVLAGDQTAQIVVSATKLRDAPRAHADIAALSLDYDPDCTSCQAGLACPFFSAFARGLDFPCTGGSPPAAERVERQGNHRVLFQDPPGVAGSGYPSGGPYPANGVVQIDGRDGAVFRASCTLPTAERAVCTDSLNDALARYG